LRAFASSDGDCRDERACEEQDAGTATSRRPRGSEGHAIILAVRRKTQAGVSGV
jgi:hypothetical protein